MPFLSIGEDIGNRKVIYEGKSELSGDFVVEDVGSGDGTMYRRLIFLSSKDIVQSEVLLKRETSKSEFCAEALKCPATMFYGFCTS